MTDRHEGAIEKAAEAALGDILGHPAIEPGDAEDMAWDAARAAVTAYLEHAHPTLTRVEDVEDLPVGTIVVDDIGMPHQHDTDGEGTWWWDRMGTEEYCTSSEIELPARVIWWPDTAA